MIDPSTALAFSLFENKGVYALLLGSGLSRAAQIPTGWEITLDLIRRVGVLQGIADEADWAAWYRQQTGEEPDYSAILDALTTTPDERRSILHSYIEPTPEDISEGRKVPTKAHHAIAWLVREGFVRVIITTNFDRLLENALREAGVEPTVISSDDDLRGAIPLVHSRCFIVKLHGDYLDTRIKNTEEELGAYSPVLNGLLDDILDNHGLITCGWSGDWDHALRAAIIRAPNRRFPMFWASRGAVSPRANDLILKRAGKVIDITDADSFFTELQQRVATQVESQHPNPKSTTLLVGTTKRYLGRPEFRIQLNDLFADEYRRLTARLFEAKLGVQGSWSPEEFHRRVMLYEAATEPLARILGVIGRWGDDASHALACETLVALARAESMGGLTTWLNLRTYPALLVLYAYGLGALKARRYDTLFRWFGQPVRLDDRDAKPAVKSLFLNAWAGSTQAAWNSLENMAQRRAPLSDHLHDITAEWTADYVFTKDEHSNLFETFEILGGLAFLTLHSKNEFHEAHAVGGQGRNFVWSPVGRVSWNTAARSEILADLAAPETNETLLKAGFGNGDAEHLELARESHLRLMSRIGYLF